MSNETPRCFSGAGNQRTDLYPCSLNGSSAQCCQANQTCASNGLCVHDAVAQNRALTLYTVGGCTDATWEDRGCVSECLDFGVGVEACPKLGSGYFCCYGTSGCNCSSTDNPTVFRRQNVEFVASLLPDGTLQSTTSLSTSTIPSATSATNVETSATKSGSSHSALGVGLGVGLGLGMPLVLAMLAALVLWRRRQKKPHAVTSSISPLEGRKQHPLVSSYEKAELDTRTPEKAELDTRMPEQYNLARESGPAELPSTPRLP